LKEDIQKNGQQFPVVLRNKAETCRFQIVSGFRRCNSLREIGALHVKAIVRNDLDDDRAYYLSYMENERRRNLTGMDKALAVLKLIERGKTAVEIQEIFGIGERQFFRLKKAADFPGEIKDAISDQFIQITHGLVLMEIFETHPPNFELDQWIDWIIEHKASVHRLKLELQHRFRKTKSQFIKVTSSGGFRLSSFTYDPQHTDEITARIMKREIMEAIRILDNSDEVDEDDIKLNNQ
jgi:ParB/RepB/Spo0J family partition protein